MNRKWMLGIGAVLLATAALIGVGVGAYRAGERDAADGHREDRSVVVGEVIDDGEGSGRRIVIDGDRWDRRGFFPGFLVIPLVIGGVVLLIGSRRRHWHGPGPWSLDEWHRRAHATESPPGDANSGAR
jgi:hypothetical protein